MKRRLRALGPPYGGGVTVWGVGLNPYRKHRRRPSDYVLVGVCLVVVVALVVWAFFG